MKDFSFKGKSIVFVMFLMSLFVFSTFAVFKVFKLEHKSSSKVESIGTSVLFSDDEHRYSYSDFQDFLMGMEFDDFGVVHYDEVYAFEIYESPRASSILKGYDKRFKDKDFRFDEFTSSAICYEGYSGFIENSKFNYKYNLYNIVGSTSLEFSKVYLPLFEVAKNNPNEVFAGNVYFTGPHAFEINERFINVLRESGVVTETSMDLESSVVSLDGVPMYFKYILVSVALLFFCIDIRFLLRYWIGYTMDDIFTDESSSLKESEVSKVFTKKFSFLSFVGILTSFVIVLAFMLFMGKGFSTSVVVLAKGFIIVFVGYFYSLMTVGALVSNFYSEGSF